MSASQIPNSRKRHRQDPSQQAGEKRQKLIHNPSRPSPSDFWDGLSKIWLTKDALRELDRRNAGVLYSTSHLQVRRPATRSFITALKNNRTPLQYPSSFLRNCRPEIFKNVKRLARHGGLNLSDLRGVCA
jgi:hypothetical protein